MAFELQYHELFSSERAIGFPMKSVFKTEQIFDFVLIFLEEYKFRTPLDLEPKILSFNLGTKETLFNENAMILLNTKDFFQLWNSDHKKKHGPCLISRISFSLRIKINCCGAKSSRI